jgi:outer membrane protein TolC
VQEPSVDQEQLPEPLTPTAVLDEPQSPTPGAPTISLRRAVALALEQNFGMLAAADSVEAARYRESAARGQFLPKLTPRYQRTADDSSWIVDASQRLPWSGASLTASGTFRSTLLRQPELSHTSDLRLVLTQPLLRGFGPNATNYEVTNSVRGRQAQERSFELSRQRLAIQVTAAFYQVVQQRELLAVARQSLKRSDSLRLASDARLKVGLVSKLDVFRAELQSSQAQESMVRSETSLESALEQFRFLLGLRPSDPLEPEAAPLPEDLGEEVEPLEILVARALENRLDLLETRDQVEDARRTASLQRQNMLPQLDVNVGVIQSGFGANYRGALRAADTQVNVFLSTSYPIERSAEKASRAAAELDVRARERGREQREMEVESEVRAAVRELERIRKSVELQRKAVEVAVQQHRLATLRYQRGLASNFDVVDAEGSLVLARSALVGLLTSYQVARVDLARITGTLDVDKEFGS